MEDKKLKATIQKTVDVSFEKLEKLYKLFLDDIKEENKKTNNELKETRKSIEFLSDKFDQITNEIGTLKSENKSLHDEIKHLKTTNKTLEARILTCETTILETTAQNMSTTIEIVGIAEKSGEDLGNTITDIAKLIQIPEQHKTIVNIKRNNTGKQGKKNIEVVFKTNQDRKIWLQQAKINRSKLTLKHLVNDTLETPIYINEKLPQQMKKLLWDTKTITKELNYKFTWVKEGNLYVRKKEDTKIFHIRNIADLEKLQ